MKRILLTFVGSLFFLISVSADAEIFPTYNLTIENHTFSSNLSFVYYVTPAQPLPAPPGANFIPNDGMAVIPIHSVVNPAHFSNVYQLLYAIVNGDNQSIGACSFAVRYSKQGLTVLESGNMTECNNNLRVITTEQGDGSVNIKIYS